MKNLFVGFLLLIVGTVTAQTPARPKLVVGIVVDQMRWDYLYRFSNRYEAGGFRRLLTQGFSCENTIIPYMPTHTAAGHACVYTGSVPALNGIVGNAWYSKELGRSVYCTEDTTAKTVGSNSDEGEMSPRNLWPTTITDELRLATNFKSKTIGIALKDRGSILPAGHTANGAYWFDNASGSLISSNYYMQALPDWVVRFNNKRLPDTYMAKNWNTLYPVDTYTQSTADEKPYENNFPGGGTTTFPHLTEKITKDKYEIFRATPYGNTYTVEAAIAAIEGENLGRNGVTDFLAVSFSSTDYVGHAYGPNSVEVEDVYLRLDKDLAALLTYLDSKVGKNQYLLFLTADHAVAHSSGFAKEARLITPTAMPGMQKAVNDAIKKEFGDGKYILAFTNYQVHLNNELMVANKIDRAALKQTIIRTIMKQPEIFSVVDLENVQTASLPETVRKGLVNGYNQKLSGELQYLYKPQYGGYEKGASHGYWNPYDSHIPLLWFGWNIKSG
ncbi:MAG: alkaline phosphatase family protein, partial [Chitinophagaceae bacterium]